MKIIIIMSFIICLFIIGLAIPNIVSVGDFDNPDFVDRIRDVRFLNFFIFPFQKNLKHIDIEAAWFYEDYLEPDYIYVVMKIRDLEIISNNLEATYVVDWSYDNAGYAVSVHANIYGTTSLLAGKTNQDGNDFVTYVVCEGDFDQEHDVIYWKIPKSAIGSPSIGSKLTNLLPSSNLRFIDYNSLFSKIDLFKDFPLNPIEKYDYFIKY
jgi:hypothetical protein